MATKQNYKYVPMIYCETCPQASTWALGDGEGRVIKHLVGIRHGYYMLCVETYREGYVGSRRTYAPLTTQDAELRLSQAAAAADFS